MKISKVAISIVTYNSKHIFEVLDNLKQEFNDDKHLRVIIFDNNSDENYKNELKKYEDHLIEVVYYHENKGFGFGHNYNLMQASEDYFLVYNPDIILTKENLSIMLNQIKEDDSISLLAPKVLNSDGSTQHLIRNRVSVFDYALRFIPFQFVKTIFARRLATYECRDLPENENVDIRISSGCFMLIRGKDFKEINGFDERFFMYFEDYDLCLELGKRNKRLVYTPLSSVVHYYERGAHKNPQLFKIFLKSMVKYFNKWGWRLF